MTAAATPSAAGFDRSRNSFSVLRYRDYAIFWTAALLSNSGSWMQTIAVPYVIFQLTHSTTWLGIAAFMAFFPALAIGPVAGSLADRFPRKRIITCTQIAMMAVAFALYGVWISGAATPGIIVGLLFLSGIASGLNITAWQAFVPQLVPREELLHAVRLNSMQFTAARAIGPALAGLVLATYGAGAAFLVNALTFLLVLVALVLITPRTVDLGRHAGRVLAHFAEAIRYVRRSATLKIAVLTIFAVSFLGSSVVQLAPALAADQFGVGKGAYGLLVATFGAGAIAGSVAVAYWAEYLPRSSVAILGIVGIVAGEIVLGSSTEYALGLVGLFIMGAAYLALATTLNTTVQAAVDEEHRGRVVSIYLMSLQAGLPLGALAEGKVAEWVGLQETVVGAALLLGLFVVFAVLRLNGLRALDGASGVEVRVDPLLVPPEIAGAD